MEESSVALESRRMQMLVEIGTDNIMIVTLFPAEFVTAAKSISDLNKKST